jgi:c-di-GMP-binding flagellar brake protein YcgR
MPDYGGAHFDRRQFPRLDTTLPCAFEISTEARPVGVAANVSLGGLLVFLPEPVIDGQVLTLTMKLPCSGGDRLFKARAEVVWAQTGQFQDGWSCQVGLRFFEMSPASFEVWKEFLTTWFDKS